MFLLSGISSLFGKDIELDAIGCLFKPYLTSKCVCMLVTPFQCDLGFCSQIVVVLKLQLNQPL